MIEKKRPRVILLESNDAVREHALAVLIKEGWAVTCQQVSKDALDLLEQEKTSPFALFISNFKLPEMEGDDILQQVKSISPLTQRMLMVPADQPDTLINAINKAEINACIISPFKDEDMIYQTRNCFKQFKHIIKRQRLKRVTRYQNKQMYAIAQKLKKKSAAYQHLIDEKKAHRLMLKSRKREAENKDGLTVNKTLSTFMEHKNILSPTADAFQKEFILLCQSIKEIFDQVTLRNHLAPMALHLGKILAPGLSKEDSALEGENTHDRPEALPGSLEGQRDNMPAGLAEKIIKAAFTRRMAVKDPAPQSLPEIDTPETATPDLPPGEGFKISISENETVAAIEKIKEMDHTRPRRDFSFLLDMLSLKQISHGIIKDEAIETWMSGAMTEKLVIARGEAPVPGHDGKIVYFFKTDFTNPGKICEDGSIDFRERGGIPHVSSGDLLARKTPPREGKPGISVFGIPIQVDEVMDPVFTAGPGTELSEDGLAIHAAIDGQPHRDALGTISVNPELLIPGDVDFETGNINFKGNIVVKGMIKEGFTVKGMTLTAKEIQGGTVDLSGDLNISAGITDSTISAHGNIYAKFINHSHVMGFGNLTITKEIIDSDVILSGSCQNSTGHIISSHITAKRGIDAGKVGTSSSHPVILKVGRDEHIEILKKKIDEALEISVAKSNRLKDEIKTLEDQDHALYRQISEKAHVQDRSQIEIKELEKFLPGLEKSNSTAKRQEITTQIQKLMAKAKNVEQELNAIFGAQDKIANKTEQIKGQINRLEETNKNHVIEKKALDAFSKNNAPLPVVTVAKTITQDSVIKGPNASVILKDDASRCKIQELSSQEDGLTFYEMMISDL